MTVKTRAELKSENAADFPNNTTRLISPTDLREQLNDFADSMLLLEDVPGLGISPETDTLYVAQFGITSGREIIGAATTSNGSLTFDCTGLTASDIGKHIGIEGACGVANGDGGTIKYFPGVIQTVDGTTITITVPTGYNNAVSDYIDVGDMVAVTDANVVVVPDIYDNLVEMCAHMEAVPEISWNIVFPGQQADGSTAIYGWHNGKWLIHVAHAEINFNGARVFNLSNNYALECGEFLLNNHAIQEDATYSYSTLAGHMIETVEAGERTVTFIGDVDEDAYRVGDRVIVYARDKMVTGTWNFGEVEYNQVADRTVVGGLITELTLAVRLQNKYRQDWWARYRNRILSGLGTGAIADIGGVPSNEIVYNDDFIANPDVDYPHGPARVLNLNRVPGTGGLPEGYGYVPLTATIRRMMMDPDGIGTQPVFRNNVLATGGGHVRLEDCTSYTINADSCELFEMVRCTNTREPSQSTELDRFLGRVVLTDCSIATLAESTGLNELEVNGGTFGSFVAAPRVLRMRDTVFNGSADPSLPIRGAQYVGDRVDIESIVILPNTAWDNTNKRFTFADSPRHAFRSVYKVTSIVATTPLRLGFFMTDALVNNPGYFGADTDYGGKVDWPAPAACPWAAGTYARHRFVRHAGAFWRAKPVGAMSTTGEPGISGDWVSHTFNTNDLVIWSPTVITATKTTYISSVDANFSDPALLVGWTALGATTNTVEVGSGFRPGMKIIAPAPPSATFEGRVADMWFQQGVYGGLFVVEMDVLKGTIAAGDTITANHVINQHFGTTIYTGKAPRPGLVNMWPLGSLPSLGGSTTMAITNNDRFQTSETLFGAFDLENADGLVTAAGGATIFNSATTLKAWPGADPTAGTRFHYISHIGRVREIEVEVIKVSAGAAPTTIGMNVGASTLTISLITAGIRRWMVGGLWTTLGADAVGGTAWSAVTRIDDYIRCQMTNSGVVNISDIPVFRIKTVVEEGTV